MKHTQNKQKSPTTSQTIIRLLTFLETINSFKITCFYLRRCIEEKSFTYPKINPFDVSRVQELMYFTRVLLSLLPSPVFLCFLLRLSFLQILWNLRLLTFNMGGCRGFISSNSSLSSIHSFGHLLHSTPFSMRNRFTHWPNM